MIKSKFLLFLLLFCSPVAMAQEQDKLLQLLKSELTYSMNELKAGSSSLLHESAGNGRLHGERHK